MTTEVFVERLWVGIVAGVGVKLIKSAIERVVISRTQVILLGRGIKLLACVVIWFSKSAYKRDTEE